MSRFKTPIIILILGILPFWFFVGSSSSTMINGEVVQSSRFNIAGLVMGLIGLGLAWSAIRGPRDKDSLRLGLIVVGAAICVLQILHSIEILTLPI